MQHPHPPPQQQWGGSGWTGGSALTQQLQQPSSTFGPAIVGQSSYQPMYPNAGSGLGAGGGDGGKGKGSKEFADSVPSAPPKE